MNSITFNLKVLTPLFMGGANQQAELRSQSFKGLFRYWYRVLGGSMKEEREIFGWGGEKSLSSLFKIMIIKKNQLTKSRLSKDFENGNFAQNGFNYLSFSLDQRRKLNDNKLQREYINKDTKIGLKVLFVKSIKIEYIKKILASIWCSFYLGNFGSRSRRGFGSIIVDSIESDFKYDDILKVEWKISIDDAKQEISAEDIKQCYMRQIEILKNVFEKSNYNDIPSIKKDFNIYFLDKDNIASIKDFVNDVQKGRSGRFLARNFNKTSINNEKDILDTMGFLMMAYRSYYQNDYNNAKNAINHIGSVNSVTIERSAFGLPLPFYFSSIKRSGTVEAFKKVDKKMQTYRRASPVIFKVVKDNKNRYHGIFIYFKSRFLPDDIRMELKRINVNKPDFAVIDIFFKKLKDYSIVV
mgnify:CR=1 FL=1